MERFRIFCKKAFSYPELLYKTHPVSAVSLVVTTLMFAVYTFLSSTLSYTDRGFKMELFFTLCASALFFTVFALFVESLRLSGPVSKKAVLFAFFGILSLFMGFLVSDADRGSHRWFFNMITNVRERWGDTMIVLYVIGLMAISLLLAMYFSYSHDVKQEFNGHVLNIFSKTFFSSIIYGVIQLGVIFLVLIVMLLLYDDAFEYLPTILVLINGLFYAPAIIYAMTHENEDANMFMQVIVRYISLVITMIAFVIIYIYMIKLVVTASVPSNSVYAILTSLFVISMFISYMCTAFEEKGFLQKFAYNCPLIFAPFILMQCYTVFVRIGQYGLTPKRYAGIAFILFEIVYIVYYTVMQKREHEIAGRNILLIMCAFLIITIFLPGISARPLSDILARHTLSSYLEKMEKGGGISDKTIVRANAAYGYLSENSFGRNRLNKYFPAISEDEIRDLHSQAKLASSKIDATNDDDRDRSYENESYGWFSTNITSLSDGGFLDISGYDRMTYVRIKDNGDRGVTGPCDPSNLSVSSYDRGLDRDLPVAGYSNIDLSDFVSEFTKLCSDKDAGIITQDEFDSRCENLCVVDIDENARIYITDASITRNSGDTPIEIDIEGYLFLKY